MHAKSIKDHRFLQAFPKSVIDNGFIQMSRAPNVWKKLSDPALGTNNLQTGWVTVEYKMSLACPLASFYRHPPGV